MIHSACTIHLLNLPEKTAKRDIIHGVKHLEEMAEDWLCARRTLCILSVLARKWNVEMPEDASVVLVRADERYGTFSTSDVPSPNRSGVDATPSPPALPNSPSAGVNQDQHSPAELFSRPASPPMPQEIPASTRPPDPLDTMRGMAPAMNMQGQVPRSMAHSVGSPALSVGRALASISPWTMPAVTEPMPRYHLDSPATSQAGGTRPVSPSSLFAVDGQDWFIKDGVNWHQNFETWALGQAPGIAPTGAASSASMFMFKGVQGSDVDASFDSLNNSMSNLDHLPGLD